MMSNCNLGDRWNADKLQRKEEARFLTKYLNGKSELRNDCLSEGSFVLNINAEWGFGKTYFLCNWADELSLNGHPVVYFDAWQNDFSKEPLIAFIATINSQLEPFFNKKIGSKKSTRVKHLLGEWYENGKKLLNPSSPILLGILAKKLAGMSSDQLRELLDEDIERHGADNEGHGNEFEETVSTVVSKAASRLLASHNSTKKTIIDFKDSLKKLTKHLQTLKSIKTPIYVFVDELDRCRPDYAIELLENIKHLFGVRGVFFVVATASEQLSHSIKKVYGYSFDSSNYLKRFFDQTYTLQTPSRHSFAEYLFNLYKLSDRENLFSPFEEDLFPSRNVKVEAFAFMADALNFSLRDMVQCCVIIDSISLTNNETQIHMIYILFLIKLKWSRKEIYEVFLAGNVINNEEINTLTVYLKNEVKTHKIIDFFNTRPATITASDIVNQYINFANMDVQRLSDFSDRDSSGYTIFSCIAKRILSDLPRSWTAGSKPRNILSVYPRLIEQAGRLS